MIHSSRRHYIAPNITTRRRPRRIERGAVDLEVVLMLGFIVGALVLTLIFVGGFADDVPTVAAREIDDLSQQPSAPAQGAPAASQGNVFEEFRRGVAAVLDSSSAAPPVAEAPVEAPAAGLTLLSPVEGETVYGDNFTLRFVAGGIRLGGADDSSAEGETALPGGLVRVTLDDGEPILLERAQPYTFRKIAEGSHVLTVELVDERLRPLSPAVTEWVRFTVENAPPPAFLPETGK